MVLEKISEDKFWRRVKRPVMVIDIQAGCEELSGLGRAQAQSSVGNCQTTEPPRRNGSMRCSCISAATATASSPAARLGDGETVKVNSQRALAGRLGPTPGAVDNGQQLLLGLTTVRGLVNQNSGGDTINQTMGATAAG